MWFLFSPSEARGCCVTTSPLTHTLYLLWIIQAAASIIFNPVENDFVLFNTGVLINPLTSWESCSASCSFCEQHTLYYKSSVTETQTIAVHLPVRTISSSNCGWKDLRCTSDDDTIALFLHGITTTHTPWWHADVGLLELSSGHASEANSDIICHYERWFVINSPRGTIMLC